MPVYTFANVGLPAEASDAVVWHLCQQRQLLLITANRNKDGEDSLEATIRMANTPSSLPVFTLADANHFRQSKPYADRVAEKLLEYFLDIDAYRAQGVCTFRNARWKATEFRCARSRLASAPGSARTHWLYWPDGTRATRKLMVWNRADVVLVMMSALIWASRPNSLHETVLTFSGRRHAVSLQSQDKPRW
jgi:hypothetical protein